MVCQHLCSPLSCCLIKNILPKVVVAVVVVVTTALVFIVQGKKNRLGLNFQLQNECHCSKLLLLWPHQIVYLCLSTSLAADMSNERVTYAELKVAKNSRNQHRKPRGPRSSISVIEQEIIYSDFSFQNPSQEQPWICRNCPCKGEPLGGPCTAMPGPWRGVGRGRNGLFWEGRSSHLTYAFVNWERRFHSVVRLSGSLCSPKVKQYCLQTDHCMEKSRGSEVICLSQCVCRFFVFINLVNSHLHKPLHFSLKVFHLLQRNSLLVPWASSVLS